MLWIHFFQFPQMRLLSLSLCLSITPNQKFLNTLLHRSFQSYLLLAFPNERRQPASPFYSLVLPPCFVLSDLKEHRAIKQLSDTQTHSALWPHHLWHPDLSRWEMLSTPAVGRREHKQPYAGLPPDWQLPTHSLHPPSNHTPIMIKSDVSASQRAVPRAQIIKRIWRHVIVNLNPLMTVMI